MKKLLLLLPFLFCNYLASGQQTVGLFLNDSLAQNGYTLFSPNQSTYLIDNCGLVVNDWRSINRPGLSVYLREDGSLLRTAGIIGDFMEAGAGGRIEIYNWEGDLEWKYDFSNEIHQQHHDIEPLPGGNFLVLAWENILQEEAIQAGRDSMVTNKNVWPDKIVELQPIGSDSAEIIWEWHAWDHLIQDRDSTKANYGTIANHPELIDVNYAAFSGPAIPGVTGIDWMHSNGLSYNADRDEIVLSVRNFSELWVIDHSTTSEEAASHSGGNSGKGGDLLYRWGNPQTYRRGAPEDQQFFQQHDARWIPSGYPNEGNLMVFNNGKGRPTENYSSVDIIQPPLDSEGKYTIGYGEAFAPNSLFSTFDQFKNEDFYSSIMSGAHPLPNGNILVAVAEGGHFFELTPEGTVVWDYFNPVSTNGPVSQGSNVPFQNVFRATKYPEDYPAFTNRILEPGEPIEFDPLPSDCQIYSQLMVSTASPLSLEGLKVLANPFSDVLSFQNQNFQSLKVQVYDLLGREVYQEIGTKAQWNITTSDWNTGWYVLSIFDPENGRTWYAKVVKN